MCLWYPQRQQSIKTLKNKNEFRTFLGRSSVSCLKLIQRNHEKTKTTYDQHCCVSYFCYTTAFQILMSLDSSLDIPHFDMNFYIPKIEYPRIVPCGTPELIPFWKCRAQSTEMQSNSTVFLCLFFHF